MYYRYLLFVIKKICLLYHFKFVVKVEWGLAKTSSCIQKTLITEFHCMYCMVYKLGISNIGSLLIQHTQQIAVFKLILSRPTNSFSDLMRAYLLVPKRGQISDFLSDSGSTFSQIIKDQVSISSCLITIYTKPKSSALLCTNQFLLIL